MHRRQAPAAPGHDPRGAGHGRARHELRYVQCGAGAVFDVQCSAWLCRASECRACSGSRRFYAAGNLPRQPAPATCPGNLPSICAVLLFTSLPAGWLTGWLDADHSTCNVSRCCCCCCCCCSRGRRGGPHSGGHPWHGNLRHGSRRAGGVPPYGPHVWRYVCVGAEGSPRGHELPAQVGFRAGGWEGGR